MITVIVHIENHSDFCDNLVAVAFDVVCLPRIGDTVFITGTMRKHLEEFIKMNIKFISRYTNCLYGASRGIDPHDITDDNFKDVAKDLSIDDFIYVSGVLFKYPFNQVHIQLSDNYPSKI